MNSRDIPLDYAENNRIITLRKLYEYSLETRDGDCGSPLIFVYSQLPRKLFAMHVAGATGGKGFGTPLNAEEIGQALNKFSKDHRVIADFEAVANCCLRSEINLPEGNFTPIGKSEFTVVSATKTKLRQSLVHGEVVEPHTAPALLTPIQKDGGDLDQ